jgi:hypothetical protein
MTSSWETPRVEEIKMDAEIGGYQTEELATGSVSVSVDEDTESDEA